MTVVKPHLCSDCNQRGAWRRAVWRIQATVEPVTYEYGCELHAPPRGARRIEHEGLIHEVYAEAAGWVD